jgi:hypothetical protein
MAALRPHASGQISKFSSFLEVLAQPWTGLFLEVLTKFRSFDEFLKFLKQGMSMNSKFWPFFEDIVKWSIFRHFSKFWPFPDLEATRPRRTKGRASVGAQN